MKQLPIKQITATLALALGMVGSAIAIAGGKGVAYVSNQDGGVNVIDLESMEIISSVDVGAKGPRGIGTVSYTHLDVYKRQMQCRFSTQS